MEISGVLILKQPDSQDLDDFIFQANIALQKLSQEYCFSGASFVKVIPGVARYRGFKITVPFQPFLKNITSTIPQFSRSEDRQNIVVCDESF